MSRTFLIAVAASLGMAALFASRSAAYAPGGSNPLLHAEASHCDVAVGCIGESRNWNVGSSGPAAVAASATPASASATMASTTHPGDAEVKADASSSVAYESSRASAEVIDTITLSAPATVTLVGTAGGHSAGGNASADLSAVFIDADGCAATGDLLCPSLGYSARASVPGTTVNDAISVEAPLSAGTYVVDVSVQVKAVDEAAGAAADIAFHLEAPPSVVVTSGSGLLPIQGGTPPQSNMPPSCQPFAGTVFSTLAGAVACSDPDSGDAIARYAVATGPSHGTVQLDGASGSFVYTPDPGYAGDDTFTFVADDTHGATSAPATASLVVANTPTGANVTVHLVDPALGTIDVTFDTVTAPGVTTLSSSATAPSLPSGFALVSGVYFELKTSAGWVPSATVCFPYTGQQPHLLHYDTVAATWVDITDGSLTTASTVCGRTTSFSPFAAVRDTASPSLSVPAGPIVNATGPTGAVVTYTASAVDNSGQAPTVSCAPPSGGMFAIGLTTVTCTAADGAGNTTSRTFTVTVKGAKEQLNELIQKVIAASSLSLTTKARLIGSLQVLVANFDPASPMQTQLVCAALKLFIAAVQSVSGAVLPTALASDWIADATRIRSVLGCR